MEEKRKLIANEKDADIFIRQLLNIGEAMYCSGGEISRIEETLRLLGKAYGAQHVSVYAITSSIVITAEFPNDSSVTQNRRITNRSSIDCLKMEKLNQLCRDCETHPVPVEELRERVLSIIRERPEEKLVCLGQILVAITFTFFFGGNLPDALVAAAAATIIILLQQFVRRFFYAEFFFNIVVSFATGAFVNLFSLIIPGIHVNQILIGDIMVLIPGIAITNSIRYIISGDIVSSLEKLIDSLIQTFGIASGFILSLLLIRTDLTDAPALYEPLRSFVQILSAGLGTLAFCMTFNMRKKNITFPAIGGVICWSGYLFFQNIGYGVFLSTLMAAILVGIYGQMIARLIKVPTTVLFIPACVPMIPGGNLYYMARAMISSDWDRFMENFRLLALFAIGIALGLAIVNEVDKILHRIQQNSKG